MYKYVYFMYLLSMEYKNFASSFTSSIIASFCANDVYNNIFDL